MYEPTDTPTSHCPRFGEAVDDEHRIVWLGDFQEGGGMLFVVVDQRAIDFVADDGDAALAGEFEQGALLLARRCPTCWISGRCDEDRFRARIAGKEQLVEIKAPTAGA